MSRHDYDSTAANRALHTPYEVNGVTYSTISNIDDLYAVSAAVRTALGPDADDLLDDAYRRAISERNAILSFEEDAQDVNLGRIRTFMNKALGAAQKDLRIFDKRNFDKAWQLSGRSKPKDGVGGAYLQVPDVALVLRSSERERLNPGQTEVDSVHELAHAYCIPQWVVGPDGDVHLVSGFGTGTALEEGWACFFGGQYAQRELGRGRTISALGGGMNGRLEKYRTRTSVEAAGKTVVRKDVDIAGGYTAAVLERAIERDPHVLEVMRVSRLDRSRLDELRSRMDRLLPNLYDRLSTLRVYDDPTAVQQLKQLYRDVDDNALSRPERAVVGLVRRVGRLLIDQGLFR